MKQLLLVVILFLITSIPVQASEANFMIYDITRKEYLNKNAESLLIESENLLYPLYVEIADQNFATTDLLKVSAGAIEQGKEYLILNEELAFQDLATMLVKTQDPAMLYTLAENTSSNIKNFNLLVKNKLKNLDVSTEQFQSILEKSQLSQKDILSIYVQLLDSSFVQNIFAATGLTFHTTKQEARQIDFKQENSDHAQILYHDLKQNYYVFRYQDENLDILVLAEGYDFKEIIQQLHKQLEKEYYVVHLEQINPYKLEIKQGLWDRFELSFQAIEPGKIYFPDETNVKWNYIILKQNDVDEVTVDLEIYNKNYLKKISLVKTDQKRLDFDISKHPKLIFIILILVLIGFVLVKKYRNTLMLKFKK